MPEGDDPVFRRDPGAGGAHVALDEQPAADLQGHPFVGALGIVGLDLDFVFHAGDAGKIFHGVLGECLVVLVLHGAGEGDDTVVGLHFDSVVEDGAEVIGGLGGGLDLAIVLVRGE